jgi:hypothetical protein
MACANDFIFMQVYRFFTMRPDAGLTFVVLISIVAFQAQAGSILAGGTYSVGTRRRTIGIATIAGRLAWSIGQSMGLLFYSELFN